MRVLKLRSVNFLRDINSFAGSGLINFKNTRPMKMN